MDLPNEIFNLIVAQLDLCSLFNLALVDKRSYCFVKRNLIYETTKIKNTITKRWTCKEQSRFFSLGKGKITYEHWNINGTMHRLDGPAEQAWGHGEKIYEAWYINGNKSRLNGPAVTSWHSSEQKAYESWHYNGLRHRLDGPAYKSWFEDGRVSCEEWYREGLKCNIP